MRTYIHAGNRDVDATLNQLREYCLWTTVEKNANDLCGNVCTVPITVLRLQWEEGSGSRYGHIRRIQKYALMAKDHLSVPDAGRLGRPPRLVAAAPGITHLLSLADSTWTDERRTRRTIREVILTMTANK